MRFCLAAFRRLRQARNFSTIQNMRAPIKKGNLSNRRNVPHNLECPQYSLSGNLPRSPNSVYIFKDDEIPKMKEAARLARQILEFACSQAEVGITTDEIDRLAHSEIVKNNAYPSPLNYAKFPKSLCTSLNEVACHGIPDDQVLRKGDLLSIDVSVFLNGYHGDNCGTIVVGERSLDKPPSKSDLASSPTANRILDGTQRALNKAIQSIGPGICITEIGNIIESSAESDNLNVIPDFCGHGLGPMLHMKPLILHFRNSQKFTLRPNMIFTIEPILTEGNPELVIWDDGWTAATKDGGWCAQFEHEVLITPHGAEVITVAT